MLNLLQHNLQVLAASIRRLARSPGSALMTVAAIGVTLSLPALLYVVTENIEQLSHNWETRARVNLFLERGIEGPGAVSERLRALEAVQDVEAIPPEQGLADFKKYSGFAQASELLDNNPLPWALVVQLKPAHSDIASVEAFMAQAAGIPGVEAVRSDVLWLKRLTAMVRTGHRLVWVLAVLLGVAVVVIISNTVRLAIVSRAHEIEVIKLIGGTDRFIRRPFLYQGFVQGALGAVTAVVLVTLCIEALRGPITALMGEYGSGYRLLGLSWADAGAMLGLGCALGWFASRWSVGRHLKDIEPR